MKFIFLLHIVIILILFPFVLLNAQTTYTWNGSNGESWSTASNWNPSRTAPATTDILQFNDGTAKNIVNVSTQTIGKLLVSNNTSITFQSTGPRTLTVGNGSGDDLVIGFGSMLTLGGSNNLTVTLANSATANISGTLTINSGKTYNTNGTSVVTAVIGTIVNSGISTSTNVSKLIFSNGSTYQHSQNGGIIPTATWNSSSTCLLDGVTNALPGNLDQSYGNFTYNCPGQGTSTENLGTAFATVNGNFSIISTGNGSLRFATSGDGIVQISGNYYQSGGKLIATTTGDRTINIDGNFSITNGTFDFSENNSGNATNSLNIKGNFFNTGGTITQSGTAANIISTIIFNGTTNQNYTGGGTFSGTINFTVNNPAGITLLTLVNFPASLTMTNGNISLNGNTLTLGTGPTTAARGALNWTSGFITGTGSFQRWFSTAAITLGNVLGLFPMGNSTDNRNVWIGGTPSTGGTVSVQHNNLTGATALSFTENSQNFDKRSNTSWTLSNANGFVGSAMSLRIQGTGIPGINTVADLNICLTSNAAGGNYSAPGGSVANPQVNRSGLTQITLANTFYFAATSGSPLPVELSYFAVKSLKSGEAQLNWKTETEINNYGFEVERIEDYNIEKLQDWEKIGFVKGNGNSNSPKNYSFTDNNVQFGKYAYRLKQIDTDGNFKYSKTIEINIGSPAEFELSQNYPNPFNPSTTIRFIIPETGIVRLIVYNLLGEQVAELLNEIKDAGVHTINFNASGLDSGVYFYRIEANGYVQSRKMTLIK